MIISDLFQYDLFPDFRLVGGAEGMGREIRTVLVFDAPDIGYWIRGGEFLLSNGYVFKEEPGKFLRFMDELAVRNVAGVGVKFGRFLSTEFMTDVHREADRIGLPVIHLPFHYDWTDIYERVLPRLNPSQRRQVSLEGSFSIDEDTDLDALLTRLCSLLERDLVFSARKKELSLFFGHPFPFADSLKGRAFEKVPIEEEFPFPRIGSLTSRNVKRPFREKDWWGCYSTETTPLFELNVALEKAGQRLSERDEQLVIRAMAILRVFLTEDLLTKTHAGDGVDVFVEQIVLGAHVDARDVEKATRNWRAELAFPARVALAYGWEEGMFPEWRKVFDHLVCRLGDLFVALVPEKRVPQVPSRMAALGGPVILGPMVSDLTGISDSFGQAKEALFWLKKRRASAGVYCHESIILDREMEAFSRRPGAEEIWGRYWKPLADEPPRQAVPADEFARALIRCNFNLRACSRELAVHYNTARNYLNALEDLLSLSVEDERDRFGLTLAERIDRFRERVSGS